ncbi:CHASE domain-containing protein [Phenylobacterium sp.]|uniref:CHASE domain-containing protein n=1 Tax=Phenylobacterium sp. TaxID=1871053 RepID=UPI0027317B1F|nr:CHASE domain-containing protein [Phenylobacterium sp.]MDP2212219.1 CHASE domain-containing protein [Phenylobacterium sp.]
MVSGALKIRLTPASWIAVLGIVLTLLLAAWAQHSGATRQKERFERQVDGVGAAVEARLDTHVALLRATVGLFAASDEVTPAEFQKFVGSLDLNGRYPGVQGIGHAVWLDGPDARARVRRDLPDGIRPWPDADNGQSAIVVLQPLDRRNRAALGYDMYSEPTRREAMRRARTLDGPAATSAVTLVQELDAERQPGFLVYLPMFGTDGVFQGWVYAPFRARDFFDRVFAGEAALDGLDVTVRDGGVDGMVLWPARPVSPTGSRFSAVREISFGGQTWRLETSAPKGLAHSAVPVAVLGVGLLLTVLLSLAWHWQDRLLEATQRARARADLLLSEVNHRAANSLQLVASFVYLQAQAVTDPKARTALVETRARILAVSRVHQRLYTDDSVEGVELKAYIETLTESLADAFEAGGRRLDVEAVEVRTDTDRAISVGVVLVELVSNAAKYAYPPEQPGDIRVRLRREEQTLMLEVEDDGAGFDPASKAKGSGLGMKVVHAMVTKLNGKLVVAPLSPGTRVSVVFSVD